jgi:hypothetical protein
VYIVHGVIWDIYKHVEKLEVHVNIFIRSLPSVPNGRFVCDASRQNCLTEFNEIWYYVFTQILIWHT